MIEEWKFWKETNGRTQGKRIYEVSNFGNVKINGVLVEYSNFRYYTIAGKHIHRLVAELFIPNPDNKPCVDHIDGNRYNNRVDNLRWVNHKENINNPVTLFRMKESSVGKNKGKKRSLEVKEQRKNIYTNRIWITNGIENHWIYSYDIYKYPDFYRGFTKKRA